MPVHTEYGNLFLVQAIQNRHRFKWPPPPLQAFFKGCNRVSVEAENPLQMGQRRIHVVNTFCGDLEIVRWGIVCQQFTVTIKNQAADRR